MSVSWSLRCVYERALFQMRKAPIPVILEAQMDRSARATDPVSEIRGRPVAPWWVLIASFYISLV